METKTYTVTLQGVIIAVSDSFADAERIARTVGTESLIECPDGTTLEFCMGWYRKVGERVPLFMLARELTRAEVLDRGWDYLDYATGQGRR